MSSHGHTYLYGENGEEQTEVVVIMRSPSSENLNIENAIPLKSSTSSAIVCRICHDGDRPEKLISPCHCNGSLALVHVPCIEKWLTTSNTDHCEICKYSYNTFIENPPFSQWLLLKRESGDPNGFYGDLCRLLFLTPMCIISAYLCMKGAVAYGKQGVWQGSGLTVLCVFVLLTYMLWAYATVRFHVRCYRRWESMNQMVRLMESSYEGGKMEMETATEAANDPFS